MLDLMKAAMKAGLPFQWNPEVGAFEANEFRVTMLDTQYRVKDLTGGISNSAYICCPDWVVGYIQNEGKGIWECV